MEENIMYLQKPTQFSHSRIAAVDSSEVWIHSCKTNPVKCNDFDECTTKTESPQEQQEDEGWETTARRTKRSRCIRADVLAKSAHPESLEFPPLLSRVGEGSLKPSSNAEQTSSKSIECDSSASNSEDPDGDQVSEPSSVVGRKKLKQIEELKSHNNQQNLDDKDQNQYGTNTKTRDCLDSDVEKLHQSSFASDCVDFLDQDVMGIVLVDVQMTVNASPLAENIPFVSLTSEAYGAAVMGYPLDVGEIRDASETSLLSKGSVECKLFGDRGSRLDQLVWRKSKRTRVCYVTSSVSASEQARKNVKNSMPPDGENNALLRKEKSLMKLLKDTKQTNKGKSALKKTCVPVALIFSKILAAVD